MTNPKTKSKKLNKTRIAESFFEIFTMILSCFAFAFIIGGMVIGATEKVSAVETANLPVLTGCCKEAEDGSICQNMNKVDAGMCKEDLVATNCKEVSGCEPGCCYSSKDGSCSLNSPKQKCEQNGGLWNKNANCEIQECQLGCCVLGEEAAITTTRQCSVLSDELKLETDFQSLDSDGTCRSLTGLSKKGACVTASKDFSDKNDCKYTTKDACKNGNFFEGYLCSNSELKTVCEKTEDTMCYEDSLYYIDSCNNPDEKKDDCDYTQGFMCAEGKTKGNAFCKNLNCANGKKHGESWCVSDYANTDAFGVNPVGSRWFKAKCIEGKITIEPCADFNQEVCISNIGTSEDSSSFSEARCVINNWRSCIAANDKATYMEVKQECDKYPDDCAMFLDIPGNEIYANLPGFIKGDDIVDKATPKGNAGKVGEDETKKIANCVPKNTPGMVFWQTDSATKKFSVPGTSSTGTASTAKTATNSQTYGGLDYGGSYEETKALCSLGSFSCVSRMQKKPANTGSWRDKDNPECNIDAASSDYSSKVPLTIEALNERCKMLGPCGINVNVVGEFGDEPINDSFARIKINEKGKQSLASLDAYKLSEDYLGSLQESSGVKTMGSITKLASLTILSLITGKAAVDDAANAQAIGEQAENAGAGKTEAKTSEMGTYSTTTGSLAVTGLTMGAESIGTATIPAGTQAFTATSNSVIQITTNGVTQTSTVLAGNSVGIGTQSSAKLVSGTGNAFPSAANQANPTPVSAGGSFAQGLSVAGVAAIGQVLGYYIGTWIAKSAGMSPGQTQAFIGAMMGLGGGIAVALTWYFTSFGSWMCTNPYTCIVAIAIAAAYMIYAYFWMGEDNKYYILQYNCEPWQPPLQGDCSVCNKDIRTCSENRCRSLGQNCKYYDDNGEPGTCAEITGTWSAKITPWQEALTAGNSYSEIKTTSFRIIGTEENGKVEAWQQLQFGITTDKPAVCKIDAKHTKTFDEMRAVMQIDTSGCATDSCSVSQGINHKIVLSQHLGTSGGETGSSTIGMNEGDNNYYIRCKNFAGQVNDAEFAVKVSVAEGPDLSPPYIKGFSPLDKSYLHKGANSTNVLMYIDEPSECRYSSGENLGFEYMTGNMTCMTDLSYARLGNLPCFGVLDNLNVGENKFYFKCKDKPYSEERKASEKRITNENAKEYTLSVCSKGLEITSVSPKEKIVSSKSPVGIKLEVETLGCVDGGKATCYYQFGANNKIAFLNTGGLKHSQELTNMPAGTQDITITCEDAAGNSDKTSITAKIEIDNSAPKILRFFNDNDKLRIITNENAVCKYTKDKNTGCSFDFDADDASIMLDEGKEHLAPWTRNSNYYIKCEDSFGNQNLNCGAEIKTY